MTRTGHPWGLCAHLPQHHPLRHRKVTQVVLEKMTAHWCQEPEKRAPYPQRRTRPLPRPAASGSDQTREDQLFPVLVYPSSGGSVTPLFAGSSCSLCCVHSASGPPAEAQGDMTCSPSVHKAQCLLRTFRKRTLDCLFPTARSCLLCHRLTDHEGVGLFLGFLFSVGLWVSFCASTMLL